eukprot:340508_1
MAVCINITVLTYGPKLHDENDFTLNLICKFFRAASVLIILLISIPFMTDIFHAAIESSHLFYKTHKQTNSDNHPNNTNEEEHKEKEHHHHHHLLHFKQSITKHSNLMKYVGISCKYIGIFGFLCYLILEFISWTLDITTTQIISYYMILTIAIIFAICNMFHHFRVYQHMNKLHHFIQTKSDPHVVAKFARAKKRLLFICITSMGIIIIGCVSLIMSTSKQDNITNITYRNSPFYETDIGYFGFIWSCMLYVMILHAWIFQSITKVSKTSIGFCLFQCLRCCRNNAMEDDINMKNLGDIVNNNTDKIEIENTNNNNKSKTITLKVEVDIETSKPENNNSENKQSELKTGKQIQNKNHLGTNNLNKLKQTNSLTPYSPTIQSPTTTTPESSADPGDIMPNVNPYVNTHHSHHYSELEINTKDLKNINVIIYDINVLLSLAYITKDAVELIQEKPIKWMTNNYVKNRIYNFEHKRSDLLRNHFEFIKHKGLQKICIISNGFDDEKKK